MIALELKIIYWLMNVFTLCTEIEVFNVQWSHDGFDIIDSQMGACSKLGAKSVY